MPEPKTYEDGLIDGEISALKQRVSDVEGLGDRFERALTEFGESLRKEFNDKLDPIGEALLGNGDPKKGLMYKFVEAMGDMKVIGDRASWNRKLIYMLLAAIVGLISSGIWAGIG